MEVLDKRATSGYEKPEAPEVHGAVAGFVPAGDYILVRRLAQVEQEGLIHKAEAYMELADRGHVVSVGVKADSVPVGSIAKFSKYGAEEINFDDAGNDRYALVRLPDVRGWHLV